MLLLIVNQYDCNNYSPSHMNKRVDNQTIWQA